MNPLPYSDFVVFAVVLHESEMRRGKGGFLHMPLTRARTLHGGADRHHRGG